MNLTPDELTQKNDDIFQNNTFQDKFKLINDKINQTNLNNMEENKKMEKRFDELAEYCKQTADHILLKDGNNMDQNVTSCLMEEIENLRNQIQDN